MNRKPFTLRQFVITGAALSAGSTFGALTDEILARLVDGPHLAAGPTAAGLTTLWVIDKLNGLIEDRKR